jgi:hypothetical protein
MAMEPHNDVPLYWTYLGLRPREMTPPLSTASRGVTPDKQTPCLVVLESKTPYESNFIDLEKV